FHTAFDQLPEEQREALVLVGAGGFSYDEAAETCGVAVGTIKSRVSRARGELERLLEGPAGDQEKPSPSRGARAKKVRAARA
ncbi:MAG: sigma factor-like helix-turn-helix DNA-binding protein, partial [Pseudomonadota bacterium]